MKKRTGYSLLSMTFFGLSAVCFGLLMAESASATGYNKKDHDVKAEATAEATADAAADAASDATAEATGGAAASDATGGDASNQLNVEGDRVENNSSNVVLVPNNNTESCVRVWGIAFGKDGSSGALGIPWRSAKCDFEQAADDAFAAGERDLGWFWKCHNKNLYKQFRGKDESKESAIDDCHARMLANSRDEVVEDLERQVEVAKRRAQAAENAAELARSHEKVCDESLDRCENKLYDGK